MRHLGFWLGLSLCWSLGTLAQGGHVGGGRFTEEHFKGVLNNLEVYFRDTRSYEAFPEVRDYDLANRRVGALSHLIHKIKPIIKDERVYYNGESRDCVAGRDDDLVPYFQCDLRAIPEANLENQPLLYMIILHEVFVIAGIERSTLKQVPSTYEASSKIRQHLALVTEYRPTFLSSESAKKSKGVLCLSEVLWGAHYEAKTVAALYLRPTGEFVLFLSRFPHAQVKYGLRKSPETRSLGKTLARPFGKQVETLILAKGDRSQFQEYSKVFELNFYRQSSRSPSLIQFTGFLRLGFDPRFNLETLSEFGIHSLSGTIEYRVYDQYQNFESAISRGETQKIYNKFLVCSAVGTDFPRGLPEESELFSPNYHPGTVLHHQLIQKQ